MPMRSTDLPVKTPTLLFPDDERISKSVKRRLRR